MTFAIDSKEHNVLMSSTKGSFSMKEVSEDEAQGSFLCQMTMPTFASVECHVIILVNAGMR